jgi:signal transduction histidine kinase/ActR/RegA family two-component response regulator
MNILKRFLGEIMVDMGFVTMDQLRDALSVQEDLLEKKPVPEQLQRTELVRKARADTGKEVPALLGQILMELGFVTPEQVEHSLKEQNKIVEAYSCLGSEELKIVLETGSLVNSTLNLAEVLEIIMGYASNVINSVASSLMLVDDDTGELVFSVPTGPKADRLTDIRIPSGVGIAGWVAENERHMLVTDVSKDDRFYGEIDKISGFETKSILCVPLKVKTKLIGVLEVINKTDGSAFSEDDALLLSVFASQAAMAIENARLYGELKDKFEQEREMQQRLARSEKMEALGLLAGGVAHDLNNVLSGIVSYPELLLMNLTEDNPMHKPISIIHESGQKAAAIVEDLLTLARRNVTNSEVLNLNTIVSDYLKSPEHQKLKSRHPGLDFKTALEPDLLNIEGFPIHLNKTLMNLITNAAEAQPDGGKVTISTRNRYVDRPISGYDYVQEGDFVVLTVADNGCGISPDDLNRIFEPFYTKKMIGRSGTGLGMTVVWNSVQDHNGYIDVKSNQEQGTSFGLYFPITRKNVIQSKPPTPVEEYMGAGEKILVIDDIIEQREIASSILGQLNYDVTAAASGEDAVEYLKTHSADILVLDMIMSPGIDGLETYRRILRLHPGQKAVIASGFSETARVIETQKLGAGAYVQKPYTLEKIGMAIKEAIEDQKLS